MPYSTNRDRPVSPLEITDSPWPLAPLNLFLKSGYKPGIFELTWSSPTDLAVNAGFDIRGVNIYRSFDSEYGPFERITELPVGALFWRDITDNVLVPDEDVSNQFLVFRPPSAVTGTPEFTFRTQHFPIVKEGSQQISANSPTDVMVFVDGVRARVQSVAGLTGEVSLDVRDYADTGKQAYVKAVLPQQGSVVTCSYRYTNSLLRTDLMQRIFYRVTTVGVAQTDSSTPGSLELVETPLENAIAVSSYETEKLDNIWKEAIHRNRWILEQGGERVKVFLRKNVGPSCPCVPDDYHKQPISDCRICYGTGVIGGYDGPYDIIIAPDDSERRITRKEQGTAIEHTYESWTGPSPILSQRDFIVKLNGERYSIGAVRFPTNRGMVLQQHFNLGYIQTLDIRQQVPLDRPTYPYQIGPQEPETNATGIEQKDNIPDEREELGRTPVWRNQTY